MNRTAIDYVKSIISQYGLDEFASNTGKINAATDQAGLEAMKNYSLHLEKLGEPYTPYDKTQLQRIIGTNYYQGGIHTPGSLLIQPAGYIRGLADGLRQHVELFEDSPVHRIETGENKKVITAKGAVEAKNIILSVNGHLESFGLYKRQLMHIFLYGSMTRELTRPEQNDLGGDPEWGITPAHPMGSTVRRTRQNRIVVRNHITYNPQMHSTGKQMRTSAKRHDIAFSSRFPMLPDVTMQYRWSGHMCLSRNSVQVFGEIEKGVYAACCHNGLGASKGTLGGMLIADLAMGVDNPMVAEMQGYDEPKKLFPEPFMTLGAKTHLWWGQRRAGRDI